MDSPFDRGTRFGDLFDRLVSAEPVRKITREEHVVKARFEAEFSAFSRPFILSGAKMNFQDADRLGQIRNNFGSNDIAIRYGDYANPDNYVPARRQLLTIRLADYIENIDKYSDAKVPPYAGNFTLPADFLATIGAGIPVYYPAETFEQPTVWLGGARCVTPLHRDSTDNFAIHLLGIKRWTIFPPHDAPYLYLSAIRESKGGDFAASLIDLRKPDLEKFPLFSKAQGMTFEVYPGDMLYLPMGWSHFVENTCASLMVNYWLSTCPIGIAALAKGDINS